MKSAIYLGLAESYAGYQQICHSPSCAVEITTPRPFAGLAAFASADGVHWKKLRQEPVLPPSPKTMCDSQNVAFWSAAEGVYVCYYRVFKQFATGGIRWVARTTSKDFLRWTPPVEMTFGDAPPEHLYTNQTSPYFRAPHIYSASLRALCPEGRC